MFVTIFLTFFIAAYLIIAGVLFLFVGKREVLVDKRYYGENPADKPLKLTKGLYWTLTDKYGNLPSFKKEFRDACDQHTDARHMFCFKGEQASYWIPRESVTSNNTKCIKQECAVFLGISPRLTSKPRKWYFGSIRVDLYKVPERTGFMLEETGMNNQSKFLVKREERVWIKPVLLKVKGKLLVYFSGSKKPNITQKQEYTFAIIHPNGLMAGFYAIEKVKRY
ncbi:hypothetical protein DSO57_1026269 [Entomophthora muscae]|uniref:Uncharacterized protein n=1 Tax=Entomophthora muscae TaxID=34485 RepID=A0ACC2RT82_9FUNG|nr:hypothetical protein DSO57_1026269 [Entomophthora muscae]